MAFKSSDYGLAFCKVLFRWRSSVYKIIYNELIIYLAAYYAITLTHFFALNDQQKIHFYKMVRYSKQYQDALPVVTALIYYMSNIWKRWVGQYSGIPNPLPVAFLVSTSVLGYDEVGRAMRRTVVRYLCLSLAMVMRILSPRVKRRFPKLKDLIDAGLMTHEEWIIIDKIEKKFPVSYTDAVATASPLTFVKLLFRWRGSVYKLLYKDLIVYLAIYYACTATYLFAMTNDQKKTYEKFVRRAEKYTSAVPLSFVLGFFVANVMTRWWNQYQGIPWPTAAAVYVSSTLHGYDEVGRAMRRTIMRYLCLSLTMVLRVLSPRIKKRFPKLKDLIGAGLLIENEYNIIEALEIKFPGYSKNWLPIVWAASIITRARKEGRIHDDFATKTIIQELNAFRGKCGVLMSYNSISIPLVYTQVVSIATYTYFMIALISNQYVESSSSESVGLKFMDLIPILIILQFIFYMGWLKVAEALMNPFGEDDDDFEVNSIIDRNLQMSYLIVDEMHNDHPELLKDQYWNEIPMKLPDKAESVEDELRRSSLNEADIVDFDVIRSVSMFGKEIIKMVAVSKDRKDSKDKQTLVQMEIDDGILIDPNALQSPTLISAVPSLTIHTPPENLKPNANVIAEVYKKIENVEEEQNEINDTIAEQRKRRKTIDRKLIEETDEKNVEADE